MKTILLPQRQQCDEEQVKIHSMATTVEPQRPPWVQRKVAIVGRWPLWEDMGVIYHLFSRGRNIFI